MKNELFFISMTCCFALIAISYWLYKYFRRDKASRYIIGEVSSELIERMKEEYEITEIKIPISKALAELIRKKAKEFQAGSEETFFFSIKNCFITKTRVDNEGELEHIGFTVGGEVRSG